LAATKEARRAEVSAGNPAVVGALDSALRALDSDERAGALIRASGIRMRIEMPDVGRVVSIASVHSGAGHIRWSFDEVVDWEPRLVIRIDSEVANRFLQGRESLAIAVARGRVKVEGDPRFTLLYIPALRLLVEPYRAAICAEAPELVVD
jgi:hypothetical protein